MKQNKQAFSIIMAIGLVILITLLAFLLLEYIIPFGRNVKGIENSSKAYYQATSGIEQALLSGATTQGSYNGSAIAHKYTITATGSLLPAVGEGNSEYDNDWNIIAPGQPIQLEIGNGLLGSNNPKINIFLRVPDLDGGSSIVETLAGGTGAIINWQLSAKDEFLSANNSLITAQDINDLGDNGINLDSQEGSTLESGEGTMSEFYLGSTTAFSRPIEGCTATNTQHPCTLKLSIINPLFLENTTVNNDTKVPYLEWQMTFNNPVPLRYAGISADGKSYGFKKQLNIKVPQQTVVEAFDFTVFQ